MSASDISKLSMRAAIWMTMIAWSISGLPGYEADLAIYIRGGVVALVAFAPQIFGLGTKSPALARD